jgi:hypothetical protein
MDVLSSNLTAFSHISLPYITGLIFERMLQIEVCLKYTLGAEPLCELEMVVDIENFYVQAFSMSSRRYQVHWSIDIKYCHVDQTFERCKGKKTSMFCPPKAKAHMRRPYRNFRACVYVRWETLECVELSIDLHQVLSEKEIWGY